MRLRTMVVLVLLAGAGALVLARAAKRLQAAPLATVAASPTAHIAVHEVSPTQTDRSIVGPDDPSIAMAPQHSRANGLLLVFLPGTGGRPQCCQLFLRQAASQGFLAIGLTYDNHTAVGAQCLNDLGCFGLVRRNRFDGASPSAYSALPARDGIEHRLTSLLSYLAARYPREGWGRLLTRGKPKWSRIVMSGHSQGGGEAAYIGTIERLRGVVTLSSPPDTNLAHQPAYWVATVPRGPTPVSHIVGFVHSGDPFYPRILADWGAMSLGAFGPLTSVDGVGAPYGHSHQLLSSAPLPAAVLAEHDSTAVDSATPGCSQGSPQYAPVWRYMLQVAGGLTLTTGKAAC